MSAFKCHVCGGETAKEEFTNEVLNVARRVLVLATVSLELVHGADAGALGQVH